jgi:hypothetical protein
MDVMPDRIQIARMHISTHCTVLTHSTLDPFKYHGYFAACTLFPCAFDQVPLLSGHLGN